MKRSLETTSCSQAMTAKKQAKETGAQQACNNQAGPVVGPTPGSVTPTNLVHAGWTYPPLPVGMLPPLPYCFPGMMPFCGPFMPFPFWMPAAAAAAASAMMMPGGMLGQQQQPSTVNATGAPSAANDATSVDTPLCVPAASAPGPQLPAGSCQKHLVCDVFPDHSVSSSAVGLHNNKVPACQTPDLTSEVCSPSVATESSNDATDEEFHFFIDNFLGNAAENFDDAAGHHLPRVDSLFGFLDDTLETAEELKL